MSKFYCNICENDVELQNGKCPKCKTDWEKVIQDTTNSEPIDYKKINREREYQEVAEFNEKKVKEIKVKEITNDDIQSNINFFLTWAKIDKIFMIIIAIIIAIISLVVLEDTDGYSLILLIFSVALVFQSMIFENSLKWKAYMLHTNNKRR